MLTQSLSIYEIKVCISIPIMETVYHAASVEAGMARLEEVCITKLSYKSGREHCFIIALPGTEDI